MWRCHCGEINLGSVTRCATCEAPRLTHEDTSGEPKAPVPRPKNVMIGFFGVGLTRPRERRLPSGIGRTYSESEIAEYYAGQKRRDRLTWLLYAVAALAVLGLLAWQLFRSP